MVKDEWSIIQCTNCQKINRIPGTEKKEPIKINDNVNHFDLYLPYVVSNIINYSIDIDCSYIYLVYCY